VYNILIEKREGKDAVINVAVNARIILKLIVMAEGRQQIAFISERLSALLEGLFLIKLII
jgi:hypothetical protein